MIKNSTRYNRLADGSPVPDVEGSDEICLSLKTTGNTSEMRSFRPVPFVDDMAYLAFPAGVAGINSNDGNACFPGFVFNESPELVKRPRTVDIPVAFPSGCPHPNATEVLHGNCRGGAFCCLYDLL